MKKSSKRVNETVIESVVQIFVIYLWHLMIKFIQTWNRIFAEFFEKFSTLEFQLMFIGRRFVQYMNKFEENTNAYTVTYNHNENSM